MDESTRKTIVLLGVFGFLSAVIMLLRLGMRKVRGQKFNVSDWLTVAAILFLLARTALTAVVVLFGNNNLSAAYRASNDFSPTEVYERTIGSKLTLVNRIVYNTYIWLQKSVVLLLYRQMLDGLPRPHLLMIIYWAFLGVTYLAVQSVTFVECKPINLYWQVVPNPGTCTQAHVQLIVFVALNIVTDLMLIVLPMPWLIMMKRSIKQRISLVCLFSIGFLLIAIAFVRLPIYGQGRTSQVNRNTWGSVEEFAAAFVASVPTLFALRRRQSKTDPSTFQTKRSSDQSGFAQVWDERILVTRRVEFRMDNIDDVKDEIEFRSVHVERSSNESLV